MHSNPELERKLIQRLIHDDEAAFCELYALYKNRLVYFALTFIKSPEFAEDIFQDAFIAVWEKRHSLNPDLPFISYIYTIVKNRIIDILAQIEKEQKLKNAILSDSIDYTTDTENRILENDLNRLLEKAIQTLTPQQKKVFEMSRKEMKSHKEIAEELNISIYTVQQHISTSLKIIHSYLHKYVGGYTDLLLLIICFNM